jgi:hypothetical protein
MSFEIPQHAIVDFLELGRVMGNKEIILWAQFMKSFTTPGFIRDGERLFTSHEQVCSHSQMYEHMDQVSIRKHLALMLNEMFSKELIISNGVADRLVVKLNPKSNMYEVRHESIGRYHKWCWINQGNTDSFVQIGSGNTELNVLRAVVERYEDPYLQWSGKIN